MKSGYVGDFISLLTAMLAGAAVDQVLTLVKRVKILEKELKTKTQKVVIFESEGEEPEDQGRIIPDIDDDPLVSLVILDAKEEINTGIEDVNTGSAKVDSGTASKKGQREGKAPM
ncbi:hypothetical protein Tco_0094770, partial [Tanacetum coccineum]